MITAKKTQHPGKKLNKNPKQTQTVRQNMKKRQTDNGFLW